MKCGYCLGTGNVPNHSTIGSSMRKLRSRSLRDVASDMGISYSRLSLMENGKRPWTLEMVRKYRQCCR